ncbi:MAG: sigma-54 dependent transcriptional regulator [Bacteroidetes bacterium]|nr:sigma-54 dependent transcriptional regulator [Bacteroidota bacterium]
MNILLVDDERIQRSLLASQLRRHSHNVVEAGDVSEALGVFQKTLIDVVLTDYKMPDGNGLDLLRRLKKLHPEPVVVILTAFGSIEGAVQAMREGAHDYLTKPLNIDEVLLVLQRIEALITLKSENQLLREQLTQHYSFAGIISSSKAMENVLNVAGRVAKSSATVLIRGESGTGKELIARAIHFASDRKEKPFIAVNCAALNENILESELFGHERGAFTGAEKLRRGRFEIAQGGSLFLDEVGDMPLSTQVKLLRVLQEKQFERVGGNDTLTVDVRILAATNRDLESAIRQGTFREDLYYRLNVVTIDIPPLRHRREDIPPLLEYTLQRFSKEYQKGPLSFSKEAWELLLRYDYPGNVRELENIVQRAVLMSRGTLITTDDLPQVLKGYQHENLAKHDSLTLPERVEKLEKDLIFEALRRFNNNQTKAAESLGISERNLRYRLRKWGVK